MNCPRKHCTGSLFAEEDNFGCVEMVCSQCSRRFTEQQLKDGIKEDDMAEGTFIKEADMTSVVKTGRGGNLHLRHQFLEEHKAEIIADYLMSTNKSVRAKWGISSNGWVTMKKRWAADIEAARGSECSEPAKGREYAELQARFDGYRQAVLDIFRQSRVDNDSKSE